MARKDILSLLGGVDRRSIGLADEVAAMVAQDLRLFPELLAGMWSADVVGTDACRRCDRESYAGTR